MPRPFQLAVVPWSNFSKAGCPPEPSKHENGSDRHQKPCLANEGAFEIWLRGLEYTTVDLRRVSASQIVPSNVALLWDDDFLESNSTVHSTNHVRSVEINPTDACNHACGWCFTSKHRNTQILPTWKLRHYLDNFTSHGGRSIHFSGGGEPLLYKPLVEASADFDGLSVLEYGLNCGLAVGVITNGVYLTKLEAHLGVRVTELAFVRVSLDATTSEEYKRAHESRAGDFASVVESIRSLLLLRGPAVTPAIGISFIVDAVHGINATPKALMQIAKLSTSMGVDFVQIKHVHTADAVCAQRLMERIHSWCMSFNELWGSTEFWVHQYDTPKPQLVCRMPRMSQVLGASGERYPCCHRFGDSTFYSGAPFESVGKTATECLAPVCRHQSVNYAVDQALGNSRARIELREGLRTSLERDGFHPYRLFPSAPRLFLPYGVSA